MVFTSMPPCTKASLSGGNLTVTTSDTKGSLYWNHPDPDLRRAMAGASLRLGTLLDKMQVARTRLQAAGDPRNKVQFYKESQAKTIIGIAEDTQVLQSLLFVESMLVNKVVEAALAMARFRESNLSDPAAARKALASFGAQVTEAFNAQLKNVAVGDALLPLGSLMFIEAAQTLDPALEAAASAMLNIIDVKDTIAFPPNNFPDNDPLPPLDIVRAETIVHTA
jgi:hypothetical protein